MAALTPPRRRALTIVREHPGIGPTPFASLMWPESKGHTTRSHRHATPAGGAVGAGIKMSAGSFLGRLEADKLIGSVSGHRIYHREYHLTQLGRDLLDNVCRSRGGQNRIDWCVTHNYEWRVGEPRCQGAD